MTNSTPVKPIADLVRDIYTYTDIAPKTVRTVLDALAIITADTLRADQTLRLPGLGDIKPQVSPARQGVMNGQPWNKPAGRRAVLRPAKYLRDALGAADEKGER
jgi:nucleoid DNA-binding protein